MSISDFGRYALGFCAAFAILAGCGSGAQSQLAPSGSFQQSSAQSPLGQLPEGLVNMAMSGAAQTGVVALHPDHGRSWMAPDAATHALLYVSDYGANDVFVYSYPDDKLVGTLTGFKGADGICVDKKGDVWIVNNNESHSGEDAVEYKHGGKKPIATLEIGAGYAVRCSVDPTTGNLAATVIESTAADRATLLSSRMPKAPQRPTHLPICLTRITAVTTIRATSMSTERRPASAPNSYSPNFPRASRSRTSRP